MYFLIIDAFFCCKIGKKNSITFYMIQSCIGANYVKSFQKQPRTIWIIFIQKIIWIKLSTETKMMLRGAHSSSNQMKFQITQTHRKNMHQSKVYNFSNQHHKHGFVNFAKCLWATRIVHRFI
jgi:hypothetical protein